MRRLNKLLTALLLVGGTVVPAAKGLSVPSHTADRSQQEYAVKAGYVYNFIKFVEWPGEGAGPIRVCALAADPYGGSLAAIADKTAKGHRLVLLRLGEDEDPRSCHVVFLSAAQAEAVRDMLRRVEGATVLTVSDAPAFADAGGMIGFVNKGNKIRFEINLQAARRAGLRVRAKLLELAWIVKDR